jgi:hypothetical protein
MPATMRCACMRPICRHLDDVRRQQEGAGEVKRSLDAQVAAVQDRQAAEAHLEAQEVQRMHQHWAQLQVRVPVQHGSSWCAAEHPCCSLVTGSNRTSGCTSLEWPEQRARGLYTRASVTSAHTVSECSAAAAAAAAAG